MNRKLSLVSGLVIVVILLLSIVSCSQPTATSSPAGTSAPATSTVASSQMIQLKFAGYHAATTAEQNYARISLMKIKPAPTER